MFLGDVSITGYQITTNIPDEGEIADLAFSCQAKRNDIVLSLSDTDMDQLHQSRVQLPSVCDSKFKAEKTNIYYIHVHVLS